MSKSAKAKGSMKIIRLVLILLILLLASQGLLGPEQPEGEAPTAAPAASAEISSGTELQVIFLDVGQADSALIITEGRAMLIDAGNLGQNELILDYLASYGVNKLDYLVASHPHADHIGAMAAVVENMEDIGTVLMPDIVVNTRVFEGLVDALERQNYQITVPQPGQSYSFGQAQIEILAPHSAEYEDMNDYSIVLRLSFGQTAFLFTGDAEAVSEQEQLESGLDLRAQVLKVGHHGSSSSTGEAYLQAVEAQYAVISCGQDNSYGHPHRETLAVLNKYNIPIYRTDRQGTMVFRSDGSKIMAPEV